MEIVTEMSAGGKMVVLMIRDSRGGIYAERLMIDDATLLMILGDGRILKDEQQ